MTMTRHLQLVDGGAAALPLATAIKVAFATSDLKRVDQHFGSAEAFAVYAVEPGRAQLVEAAQFGRLAQDGNEDKLVAKLDALDGCIAVYTQAVGASAISQLKARGIQPMKVAPGTPIGELLATLQGELRGGPDSWLAQALRRRSPADPGRFDSMDGEEWQE